MKIFVDYKKKDSGAGKFFQRLMREFRAMGHTCSFNMKKADVHIAPMNFREKRRAPVMVLRVDGVHFLKGEGKMYRNLLIRKSIKAADGVVFQSEFSRKFARKILKVNAKSDTIIYNGADPADYRVDPYQREGKLVVVSGRYASDERPHKRMKDMAKIAAEYAKMKGVTFWFCGRHNGEPLKCSGVKFLGNVPEKKLRRILVSVDAMLYLAWYDWCPNAVVEALVAGLPVVCSNQGGTREIVGQNGVVVEIDDELTPKVLNAKRPPKFEYAPVYNALDSVLESPPVVDSSNLHIHNVAKAYLKYFRSLM